MRYGYNAYDALRLNRPGRRCEKDKQIKTSIFFIIFFLFSIPPLHGEFSSSSENLLPAENIRSPLITPITLEHAYHPDSLFWGLMQRKDLEESHGMTFNFDEPKRRLFWMFNCLIDLSVAFCDRDKVIREIYSMKAYPEKLDPKRPLNTIKEISNMDLYSYDDPILSFFREKGVTAKEPSQYALEMRKGWFHHHSVQSGDLAVWDIDKSHGYISHTLDLELLDQEKEETITLLFPDDNKIRALWQLNSHYHREVHFFDNKWKSLKIEILPPTWDLPKKRNPVIISPPSTKYALITILREQIQ